jgi:hypothetical protein
MLSAFLNAATSGNMSLAPLIADVMPPTPIRHRSRATTLLAAILAISSAVACSGPPDETVEQYAKNPYGCNVQSAEWYADRILTTDGQAELKKRAKNFQMRGDYHGTQIDFSSISKQERSEHLRKAIQCLTEVKWSLETLAKAGISAK